MPVFYDGSRIVAVMQEDGTPVILHPPFTDWYLDGVPSLRGEAMGDGVAEVAAIIPPHNPLFNLGVLEEAERRGFAVVPDRVQSETAGALAVRLAEQIARKAFDEAKPKQQPGKEWTTVDGVKCHWVTMHGTHVCISAGGEFVHELRDEGGKPTKSVTFNASQSQTIKKTLSNLARQTTTPEKLRAQLVNMQSNPSWFGTAQALQHALDIHEGKAKPPEGLFKPKSPVDPNAPKKIAPLPDFGVVLASNVTLSFGTANAATVGSWTHMPALADPENIKKLIGGMDGAKAQVSAGSHNRIIFSVTAPGAAWTVYVTKGPSESASVRVSSLAVGKDAPADFMPQFVARMATGLHELGISSFRIDKVTSGSDKFLGTSGKSALKSQMLDMGFDAALPPDFLLSLPASFPVKDLKRVSDLVKTPAGRKIWDGYGGDLPMAFHTSPRSESVKSLAEYMKLIKGAVTEAKPAPLAATAKAFEVLWDATFKAKFVPHTEGATECHWVTIHGTHVCITEAGGHVRIVKGPEGLIKGYEHFNKPQSELISRHLSALEAGRKTLDDLKAQLAAVEKGTADVKAKMGTADASQKRLLSARVSRNQQEAAALRHVIERKEDKEEHIEQPKPPPKPEPPKAEPPKAAGVKPEPPKEEVAKPKPHKVKLAPMPPAPDLDNTVELLGAQGKAYAEAVAVRLAKALRLTPEEIKAELLLPVKKARTVHRRFRMENEIYGQGLEIPDALRAVIGLTDQEESEGYAAKITTGYSKLNSAFQNTLREMPLYDLHAVQRITSVAQKEFKGIAGVSQENVGGDANMSTRRIRFGPKMWTGGITHEIAHVIHGILDDYGVYAYTYEHRPAAKAIQTDWKGVKKDKAGSYYLGWESRLKATGAVSKYGATNIFENWAELFRSYYGNVREWQTGAKSYMAKKNVDILRKYKAEACRVLDAHYTAALLERLAVKGVW